MKTDTKTLSHFIIAIVLTALLSVGICLLVFKPWIDPEPIIEYVEVTPNLPEPTPTIIEVMNQPKLEDLHFENMGKLATTCAYYTEVISSERAAKFFGTKLSVPLTKNKFIASINGIIKAGIDFTLLTYKVNDERQTITIFLPPCEIISNELDFNSFIIYYEKNNILNPISVDEINASYKEILTDAENHTVQRGLTDNAIENAKTLIKNMCQSILPDYTIIFHS